MCWEEQRVTLSQTTLTIFFRAKWSPIFSLQFLHIMMNFARFKNQRNLPSAALSSYKVGKDWRFGEKERYFPFQGLLEDRAGCSERQIPVSSSSLELCPSYRAPLSPRIHAESTSPMSVLSQLWLITGKDQRAVLSHNGFFWDKYPEPELSLWKFRYTGILFQVWDTTSCPCFCKISSRSHTICDPMHTALEGTCEGQHPWYVALPTRQIRTAPSKSYLPRINCCSISCLEIKLQPPQ